MLAKQIPLRLTNFETNFSFQFIELPDDLLRRVSLASVLEGELVAQIDVPALPDTALERGTLEHLTQIVSEVALQQPVDIACGLLFRLRRFNCVSSFFCSRNLF